MNKTYYIVLFFIICILKLSNAQNTHPTHILNNPNISDTIIVPNDTLKTNFSKIVPKDFVKSVFNTDSISRLRDSIPLNEISDYKISKDALEDDVLYDALDSSHVDLVNNRIHLYGGAKVEFQKIKLSANYMVIDFKNNIIEGFHSKDSIKVRINPEKPTFSDGENTFTYRQIKYNFKSKKGLVDRAITQQGEFNIVGDRTKFVTGATDTLGVKDDDQIYNQDAIITTCTHDPPHFGIKASRGKFIPNKVAVMSMAQLEIAKIPTPLIIPFGFFPLIQGKSSGLIFPSSYEYNEQLGLGFREVGYYWPINEYMDMRLTGDIYTRGSHGVRINTTYRKRYGYSGNILLGYSNNIRDNDADGSKVSAKSFSINVSHRQDSKAHPYRNLGGSVNIQTNRYDQRTFENPTAALNNTYSSNFTLSHDMPGTPFRFNMEFRHSQNTQTRVMDITLPNMSLRMNTIFPFKRKNSTKEVWSDNVALTYSSEFRNFVKTTDTTLFTQQTLKDIQTGLQQRASISTNMRLFTYINLSPSINYDETWLRKKYNLTFNPDSVIREAITRDTLGFKSPEESFTSGFYAHRNFTAAISLNTQRFFTKKWSKGFVRGIRHVAKPNMSFYYQPGNKERYEAIVNTDTRPQFNNPRTYSIFTNSPFGTLQGFEEQMGISYGITNIFEAKHWSKKDSTEKIIRLFDNISVNGTYNFIADSFKFSDIFVSGNTTVLKGLTNFNFRATFSPYVYDVNNRRTKETVWDFKKRPIEFVNFSGQFSTSISFGRIRQIFSGQKESNNTPQTPQPPAASRQTPPDRSTTQNPETASEEKPTEKETSLAQWFENFNISHAFNFDIARYNNKDTFFVQSHSINISGSIPLTKNWNMNIGNIAYDFKSKSFVYPYFSFARDLHCWQMNFTWAPSNGVYSFFIGVKSSTLSFLKYDYGQRNANTLFTGQRR
ncbi:MAG: hypothetical protein RIR48_362 [Bacteroidota bacterium]